MKNKRILDGANILFTLNSISNLIIIFGGFNLKELLVQELLQLDHAVLVDVRSPGEFEESSIPGAINIPIFTNEERKEVGTLYKQRGSETAKWRAMEIVAPKLPAILGEINKLEKAQTQPVIYCWRGGMRSKSVATFMEFSGMEAVRLNGGYRAYREYILENIPSMIPNQAIVLHGMTGTGKTEILASLKGKGLPVIDLEKMAAHRGSLFGTIGLGKEGNNQKTFDSELFEGLRAIQGFPYFLIEAESQRIGKAGQPKELYEKKLAGFNIYIEASVETRVKRIYREYVEPNIQENWFHITINEKLLMLKKRIKNAEQYNMLLEHAKQKNYEEVIRILLIEYYDPRYQHKQHEYKNEFYSIQGDDLAQAIQDIQEYFRKTVQLNQLPH